MIIRYDDDGAVTHVRIEPGSVAYSCAVRGRLTGDEMVGPGPFPPRWPSYMAEAQGLTHPELWPSGARS